MREGRVSRKYSIAEIINGDISLNAITNILGYSIFRQLISRYGTDILISDGEGLHPSLDTGDILQR